MSEHRVEIEWKRETEDFAYDTYDRSHRWTFPGGPTIRASAAPEFQGDASLVDPEQALVGAIASCHMLTFLAVAARRKLTIDTYADRAVGYLEKNDDGRLAVTRVELHPTIEFAGDAPDADQLRDLHDRAHRNCFIANSVHTKITVET